MRWRSQAIRPRQEIGRGLLQIYLHRADRRTNHMLRASRSDAAFLGSTLDGNSQLIFRDGTVVETQAYGSIASSPVPAVPSDSPSGQTATPESAAVSASLPTSTPTQGAARTPTRSLKSSEGQASGDIDALDQSGISMTDSFNLEEFQRRNENRIKVWSPTGCSKSLTRICLVNRSWRSWRMES